MRCAKCGRRGHLVATCKVDLQAASREACENILKAARKYPLGIERRALLDEAGIKHQTGFRLVVTLRQAGKLVKRQVSRDQTLFTAAEHKEEFLAYAAALAKQVANKREARQWPEYSVWVPPQPRIPSVWHLAQL